MDANVAWGQISVTTKMAVGAREASGCDDNLSFRVGTGPKLCKVVVRLNAADLYDIELIEIKRKTYDIVTVRQITNVDCEDLSGAVYSLVNG